MVDFFQRIFYHFFSQIAERSLKEIEWTAKQTMIKMVSFGVRFITWRIFLALLLSFNICFLYIFADGGTIPQSDRRNGETNDEKDRGFGWSDCRSGQNQSTQVGGKISFGLFKWRWFNWGFRQPLSLLAKRIWYRLHLRTKSPTLNPAYNKNFGPF